MKFATAYYLLLIYATVILKPLLPVAEDGLLHCFAEAYHVATVHATEGKDHVEKEMAAAGADDASSKKQKTDKAEQSIHETAIYYALSSLISSTSICSYPFTKESIRNIYIDFINPPPRI
ncbi:MAG TPA: hypothetical protein VFW07_28265 [Parafilimonas sp.]|nr:hypothetical protein [Parafilimonas sp.]